MISLYKIGEIVPAIVINDQVYSGFLDKDKLESYLPAWMTEDTKASTTKATSTGMKK